MDSYRDEDGEPLVDFDDVHFDDQADPQGNIQDRGWDNIDQRQERSPTPVYNEPTPKPRKRLIKKSSAVKESGPSDFGLHDDVGDHGNIGAIGYDAPAVVRDETPKGGKRKGGEVEKRKYVEKKRKGEKGEGKLRVRKSGGGRMRNQEEVKEMWDTVAGGNSEDDQEGTRNRDDDNFIDDTGVDAAEGYGSDNAHSPSHAPQAEEGEDNEIDELFKIGKKKKKNEKSAAEIALLVENVMAELEVVAEADVELNKQQKPAVNKLKKLSLLTDVLSKKHLQQEFLDHGILNLLKVWLEPLPDGSLPNINVRATVLQILHEFPIDLEQLDRRDQLKKSGLGKVIMFLSKTDEETTANRKLAKELVDKWSRPIFNKSTRFEDMKNYEPERSIRRPAAAKKATSKGAGMLSHDDDLDEFSQGTKSGQSSSRTQTTRPEAMPMDFMIRPQSKVDPDAVRAQAKQMAQDQRHAKMNKKLQQLKTSKKKQLQATKLSVEGRGMVKYL